MDLVLSEEQELLQHTAREFVAGRSSLKRIRTLRDTADPDGFSRALWREMARLGWTGILLPGEHGGLGLGCRDLVVVMEELGRGLMPEPMLSTVLLGANAILLGGSDAQRGEHLPTVAAGDRFLALAWQEPGSRYDPHHVETRAERAGGGWRLRGEKIQVLDGAAADRLVVSARTAGGARDVEGITLFVVRSDAPGVALERQVRVDSRGAALLHLADARVEPDAVLGQVGRGGPLLAPVLDRATVGLTAEMLGSMSAAFEMTIDYLKTRVQFGVPIGSFQALKHRAARMFVELELARSAVMHAHRVLDEGRDDAAVARAASIAKARCSDAFLLIGNEGVQMHGGIGMTDEHDIGFFLKRARVAQLTLGDAAPCLPGLCALHGHVGGNPAPPWVGGLPDLDANLRAYLYCGVTTILDPADIASQIFPRRERVRRGELLGPTIYASGPMFTAPGGHPVPVLRQLAPWWLRWYLIPRLAVQVDTPQAARSAVDEVVGEGAHVIKIGVDHLPDQAPRIGGEVLAAVVDEARRRGVPAVAHLGTVEDAT